MQETQIWFLGWEDPLEKGMETHSSILAWRIPWTEEPGGLRSIGSQRVRHDWATNTFAFWTVAQHAPLSMEFSRQECWSEYWSGLLFPSPGDLPDPGIESRSPALQEPPGKPLRVTGKNKSDSNWICFFYFNLCSLLLLLQLRMLPVAWNIQDSPFSRLWPLKE